MSQIDIENEMEAAIEEFIDQSEICKVAMNGWTLNPQKKMRPLPRDWIRVQMQLIMMNGRYTGKLIV